MDTTTSLVPELSDWITIFRTGTHIDSQGQEDIWTDNDLDKLIANFQPNTFSVPIVLGHQTADYSPAQGWVASLKKQGGLLYAKLANVLENFAISFKNKQYPNRSVAIDITNEGPVLRHLAFLGAVPPAIELPPVLQFKRYLSSHVYSLPLEPSKSEATTCDADVTTNGFFIECGGGTENPNAVADAISKLTSAIASIAEITPSLQSIKTLQQSLLTGDTPMPAFYAATTGTTGTTATSGDTGETATTEMAAPPFPPKPKSTTGNTGTSGSTATTEMAAPTQEYELAITSPPPMSMQSNQTIPPGMVLMSEAERNALLTQGIASACDALLSSAKLFIEQLKVAGKITPAIIDELADFICFLEKIDSTNPMLAYAAQTGQSDRAFSYFDRSQGRQVRMRPADYFKKFLANLPTQVQVGRQGHDYSAAVPASPTPFQPNSANTAFIVSEVIKHIHGGT